MIDTLRNRPLILNSDLDGLLSGLFLKKYLNCSIVGFSNSEKEVWLRSDFNGALSSVCFVDLYVQNSELVSIDQHIVSVNKRHHSVLFKNENKINPNLIHPHFHQPTISYRSKYPFGTIHFVIALLEREGINFLAFDLFKKRQGKQLIDLILRADDTMKTSIYSNYKENAKAWWEWLVMCSNQGKTILTFKDYLDKLSQIQAEMSKKQVGQFLKNPPYNCDSSDGGIRQLTINGFIRENVFSYIELLCEFLDMPIFNLGGTYRKFTGNSKRMKLSKRQQNELIDFGTINGKRIFSYAFVRTNSRDENFSVTFYQT